MAPAQAVREAKIPKSAQHPLSVEADYANPRLYGGAAVIVGVLGLVVGLMSLATGGFLAAAAFGGLGLFLLVVGYWMYTRAV